MRHGTGGRSTKRHDRAVSDGRTGLRVLSLRRGDVSRIKNAGRERGPLGSGAAQSGGRQTLALQKNGALRSGNSRERRKVSNGGAEAGIAEQPVRTTKTAAGYYFTHRGGGEYLDLVVESSKRSREGLLRAGGKKILQ